MEFSIENSDLRPDDLSDGPLRSAHGDAGGESGYRGVASDIISGAAEGSTGAAAGALITALWLGWRKLRDRQLKDSDPVTVTVELQDATSRTPSVRVVLSADPAAAQTVETAVNVAGLNGVTQIRIRFPD